MRITAIDLFPVTMSLEVPIPMASGVIESTRNVIVRVSAGGVQGWGEAVEAPALNGQGQSDIMEDLENYRAELIGGDPEGVGAIWDKLMDLGAPASAVGAVDIALHDLVGKVRGVPAHRLIGRARRSDDNRVSIATFVAASSSCGIRSDSSNSALPR